VLEGHRALNDARMAAGVFRAIATKMPLQFTEPVGLALPISAYANRKPPHPRPVHNGESSRQFWSLGTRIAELPASTSDYGPSVSSVIAYVDLLRDVLADRMLTSAEVDSLFDLADSLNLSRSEVRTIHSTFVSEICEDALSDGFISSAERDEISQLASVLDVRGWEAILDQQAERRRASGKRTVSVWNPNLGFSSVESRSTGQRNIWARESSISQSDDLATRLQGKSVVITGEFVEFSREDGRSAILRRGGKAPGSVSRKTFAVVVGESAGPSKIERCFEFGIPMLNYEEFCSLLDSGQLP
jgi:hypothetical protein